MYKLWQDWSVIVAFGVGVFVGSLLGWVIWSNGQLNNYHSEDELPGHADEPVDDIWNDIYRCYWEDHEVKK